MKTSRTRPRVSKSRQAELRKILLILAMRTTKSGTFTELAEKLKIRKENVSLWIRNGYVPVQSARRLLKLRGAQIDCSWEIETQDSIEITLEKLLPPA